MRVLVSLIVGCALAASAAPGTVGQQTGGVPNTVTIDFSRLNNIPATDDAFDIRLELTVDRNVICRVLNMTFTPGKADADAVFDLAELAMLCCDWVATTSGKHTLTIHTRNVIERNVITYRAITAVRFEGKVGGPERMPRITTTGKVKVISP